MYYCNVVLSVNIADASCQVQLNNNKFYCQTFLDNILIIVQMDFNHNRQNIISYNSIQAIHIFYIINSGSSGRPSNYQLTNDNEADNNSDDDATFIRVRGIKSNYIRDARDGIRLMRPL